MLMGMMRRRRTSAWIRLGASAGLAVSLHVPVAVVLVWARPDLLFGYPLVLLPILLAGPLAIRSLAGARALAAALVAGLVSSLVTVASLAIGSQLLGGLVWALVAPTSMAPVPALPHLMLMPDWLMTWGQQDLWLRSRLSHWLWAPRCWVYERFTGCTGCWRGLFRILSGGDCAARCRAAPRSTTDRVG